MRLLIIALLAISVGTAACSKKGSNSVATPPPVVTPDPNPPGPVDPSSLEFNLSLDYLFPNKISHSWLNFNSGADARYAYEDLMHSAISYAVQFQSHAKYGTASNFNYKLGLNCNLNFLDAVYDIYSLDFASCTEYYDHLAYLAQGQMYIEITQVAGPNNKYDVTEGFIHVALYSSYYNAYVTHLKIPFRGQITKNVFAAPNFRYNISIGSQLLLYTAANTQTNPNLRELTMDFGIDELGYTQLVVKPNQVFQ